MTNTPNDALALLDATAATALTIARDLRTMRIPSISLSQIETRLRDYCDDPSHDFTNAHFAAAARDIAAHPAIRNAIR